MVQKAYCKPASCFRGAQATLQLSVLLQHSFFLERGSVSLSTSFPNTAKCFSKHFDQTILFPQPAAAKRGALPCRAGDLDVFSWMENWDQNRAADRVCLIGPHFLPKSWAQAEARLTAVTLQTGSCPQNTAKSLIRTYLGQSLRLAGEGGSTDTAKAWGMGWSSVLMYPMGCHSPGHPKSSLPGTNIDPDLRDYFTTTLPTKGNTAAWNSSCQS